MHILLAGGIFRFTSDQIERRQPTPEVNLALGLRDRGIQVTTLPLEAVLRIAFPVRASAVHVHHSSKAALAAALSPVCRPMIFTAHQTGVPPRVTRRLGLIQTIRFADATVCLSDRERAEKAGLVPQAEERLHVIPNGMVFEGGLPPKRVLADDEEIRALFVGQLIPVKRVDRIIRAVKVLPRLRLRLVYHNNELETELRRLTERLGVGDRVAFVGSLGPEALRTEYAAAHVLVLPSEREALPSVVTEALASGLPVLASETGGLSMQVENAGVLSDPRSDSAVQAAIVELTDRYALLAAAAQYRAVTIRRELSRELMVDRHIALYESLLGRR